MSRTIFSKGNVSLIALALGFALIANVAFGDEETPLSGIRRVVFLGDSITYAGQYIEDVEAYSRLKSPDLRCEFLNLGLPSETVSGLSEPGHAGGAFPRPGLHERLDRVLSKLKPDLIVACYGMNDGIYHPFGEDRFKAYRDGMTLLHEKATASGAKVLHLTSPPFDAVPIKGHTLPGGLAEYRQPYERYDDVLSRYADWLVSKRAEGWDVIDIHALLRKHLDERRARDPMFRFAGDGVHLDANGHWRIAGELLRHWRILDANDAKAESTGPIFKAMAHGEEILALVQQRQRLLKNAWLADTGHKRPGMRKGVSPAEAERQAEETERQIRILLASKK